MSALVVMLALAAGPENGAFPASLEKLFTAKDDSGQLILGDAERKVLDKLPSTTRERIAADIDSEQVAGAAHLKTLLGLELSSQTADIVFSDNCVLCHSDPERQSKKRLFSADPKASGSPEHLNLKNVLSDVHFRRGLGCAGCHGGKPSDEEMFDDSELKWPDADVRKTDRTWIPEFCARCHADPVFMRGFNPSMPTDQLAKYKTSKHGVLLLEKHDSKAAQCVSCHGVHGIRGPQSRSSKVHAQSIPSTCGACHGDAEYMAGYKKEDGSPLPTNQVEQFKGSVHGKALLEKGDLGAPACNDCHGNHAAMPPAVASVSQVCRTCHAMNGTLFDGSNHKKAFEKNKWPECETCHGKHDIQKPNDELISDAKDGLCGKCHAEHAKDNPKCNEGARLFRSTLTELAARAKGYPPVVEHLAERGLDTDPVIAAQGELDEALVQARTRVHTFDRGGFEAGAKGGLEAVQKLDALVAAAEDEQRFRRNGLLVSIALMALLAVGLALKIREIDRRRAAERAAK